MRYLLSLSAAACVAIATTSFFSSPSRADQFDYPWCSISSTGQSGMPVCRFSTLEQCRASVINGYCDRNAVLVWQEQQAQAAKRKVR